MCIGTIEQELLVEMVSKRKIPIFATSHLEI
jgi:hypothetical protein